MIPTYPANSANQYITGPILLSTGPTLAPEPYEDPKKRPDKWDFAEALKDFLDDKNLNGIGKLFVMYNDADSADLFVETFPLYDDEMPGTNFRISITRSKAL